MYTKQLVEDIIGELENLKGAGKLKVERELTSAQGPEVEIAGRKVLMFASNNYLGLGNHPALVKAAHDALDHYGYGLSSVRFICGTQELHRQLEKRLAKFLGVDDAILYSTCFMANLGFFASITNESLGHEKFVDAIYSDALNHASIIDALRLVKKENVEKKVYPHNDLAALEAMLKADADKVFRYKMIVTDGVFSMEGDTAHLAELVKLAEQYGALLFVDDAHGVGVLGKTGAGTPELHGVHGKIDVLSGTLGKALGGAVGGYLAGKQEMIDLMRQKSRTYMFSNSLPPSVVMASLAALDLLEKEPELLARSSDNTKYFRSKVEAAGFKTLIGDHPIVPVMLGDAALTQAVSKRLLEEGLYVVGLWFPVVPDGHARLRFQISAAHTHDHINRACAILEKVGREMKII